MISAEEVARAGYKYIGTAYSTMDCQKFVEACLRDAGMRIDLAGSNAWYRKMTVRISPEECRKRFGEIPRGAWLFIVSDDGGEPERYHGDRMGNASHMGIYTGDTADDMLAYVLQGKSKEEQRRIIAQCSHGNGAIHSSQSRGCVCTSKFAGKTIPGGWNMVGLWNALSYDNLAVSTLFGQTGDPDAPAAEQSYRVTAPSGGTVNLRTGPSKSSIILERVPVGSVVHGSPYDQTWKSVQTDSNSGYMMSEFLQPIEAQESVTYRVTINGVTWDQYKSILAICPMAEAERE